MGWIFMALVRGSRKRLDRPAHFFQPCRVDFARRPSLRLNCPHIVCEAAGGFLDADDAIDIHQDDEDADGHSERE